MHVEWHGVLLDLIEAGNRDAALRALADHGERSFTQHRTSPVGLA